MKRLENGGGGSGQALPFAQLISVGAWYRNPWTLSTIELPSEKSAIIRGKAALQGREMAGNFAPDIVSISQRANDKTVFVAPCDPHPTKPGHHIPCRAHGHKWCYFLQEWLNAKPKRLLDLANSAAGRPLRRKYKASDLPSEWELLIDTKSGAVNILSKSEVAAHSADVLSSFADTLLAMHRSVSVIPHLDDHDFDDLLAQNVVFLNLIDASAVNTVIECIVRNTPLLVNPLPAVVEYLGKDYPLYYRDPSDVGKLLTEKKLIAARKHIAHLDKSALTARRFIDDISAALKPVSQV
jgi:hypothetical protein